jgi:predicted phosphodiesterase
VAFLHGHDITLLRHTIYSGQFDLVCHGHTHAFYSAFEGRTLVLNPGALARTSRPSLAIVDLASLEVTEVPV